MATKIQKLAEILAGPAQEIEDAFLQLLTERAIDTATGAQLDLRGRIVGQDREGLADADYRRYIRARIWVNRSSGTHEELTRVGRLILKAFVGASTSGLVFDDSGERTSVSDD